MLGVVPVGRFAPLALAELHGRPLLSYAVNTARALTPDVVAVADSYDAGLFHALSGAPAVQLRCLDDAASVEVLRRQAAGARIVLHDPRCPLLPVADLRRVAGSGAAAAVGVRPVTDTVKTVRRSTGVDLVSSTVSRDDYRAVCSPLSLSPGAASLLDVEVGPAWWTADLWLLVAALRPHVGVELVEVSSLGRRVEDADALRLLASLDDVRQVEHDR